MASDPGKATRPLKILMLAPTPFFSDRGCHVRIHEEARALRSRGHQVGIVTYHLGRNVGAGPIWRTPNIPWYSRTSAGPSWHKPYLDILLLYKAWRAVRAWQPDIVHAHLHEGAFIGILLRRITGLPVLFDCQGSLTGEVLDHGFMRDGSLLHRIFAGIEAWVNRQADYIVTSSTGTAEWMKGSWPELAARLEPLPDAVDTELFRPCRKDPTLMEKLGIPSDKTLLVYLGAMSEYQGLDLLLDALAILFAEREDVHALLMGYPEQTYAVKAEELRIADRVTFAGRIAYADAPRYLSLGDVALSPKLSQTEANGKLLSYMGCGLPCVVFDNPVNRELLGDCGIYVVERHPQGYAKGVGGVLDNVPHQMELSQCSRERAVNSHSWPARIETLEKIYSELINEKNP